MYFLLLNLVFICDLLHIEKCFRDLQEDDFYTAYIAMLCIKSPHNNSQII